MKTVNYVVIRVILPKSCPCAAWYISSNEKRSDAESVANTVGHDDMWTGLNPKNIYIFTYSVLNHKIMSNSLQMSHIYVHSKTAINRMLAYFILLILRSMPVSVDLDKLDNLRP